MRFTDNLVKGSMENKVALWNMETKVDLELDEKDNSIEYDHPPPLAKQPWSGGKVGSVKSPQMSILPAFHFFSAVVRPGPSMKPNN